MRNTLRGPSRPRMIAQQQLPHHLRKPLTALLARDPGWGVKQLIHIFSQVRYSDGVLKFLIHRLIIGRVPNKQPIV